MSLTLVPFNSTWVNHDKIDLHAIYRRPRFVEDKYGEKNREYKDGVPTWDLTGPLPVRLHNRWTAKGFEYVTLSDRESLAVAARFGTLPPGKTAKDYDQHQTGGPWNYRKYAEGQEATFTLEAEQLRADVDRFGSEAVEAIRQQTDSTFVLPGHLRGVLPKMIREMQESKRPVVVDEAKDASEGRQRKQQVNA